MSKNILMLSTVVSLALGGCGYPLHSESEVNLKRVEVERGVYSERFPIDQLNDGAIVSLSHHYYRFNAEQPLEIVVLYDPQSRVYGAMSATNDGLALVEKFRLEGVRNVVSKVLPVGGANQEGVEVLVRFDTLSAERPEGCQLMNGFDGKSTNVDYKQHKATGYEYGCTIEDQFAKQIARPRDLVREPVMERAEGRRSVNAVSNYVYGVPNEALEGYSASEVE